VGPPPVKAIYPGQRTVIEKLLRLIYKLQRNPMFHEGTIKEGLDAVVVRAMIADLLEHYLLETIPQRTVSFFKAQAKH
jgi:hypothetical protein